jgi:hypothetical protein
VAHADRSGAPLKPKKAEEMGTSGVAYQTKAGDLANRRLQPLGHLSELDLAGFFVTGRQR